MQDDLGSMTNAVPHDRAQTHAPDASIQDDLTGLTRGDPVDPTPQSPESSVQDELPNTDSETRPDTDSETRPDTDSAPSDEVRPWSKRVIIANIVVYTLLALVGLAGTLSPVFGDSGMGNIVIFPIALLGLSIMAMYGAVTKSRKQALSASKWCNYLLLANLVFEFFGFEQGFSRFALFLLIAQSVVRSVTQRQGLTEAELVEYDRKVKEKAERRRAHRRRD